MTAAELQELLERVATGGLQTREEAISRLVAARLGTVLDFLLDQIAGRDFGRRNAAIEVLARLGPAALGELIPRLKRRTTQDWMFVTPVLSGYNDPRALPLLHDWLHEDDPNLVATVCEALGHLRSPESIPHLAELVSADPWSAGPALIALGEIGHTDAFPVLDAALDDEDVRPFAIEALGRVGVAEAWPRIAEVVRDDPSLAGLTLEHIGPVFRQLGPDGIRRGAKPPSLWRTAARNGLVQPASCYAAVRLLGALHDAESIEPLIDRYLAQGEEESIPGELARIPGAAAAIQARLGASMSDEESRRMVRLVFNVMPDPGNDILLFLTHPNSAVRLEIVLYLGAWGRRFAGALVGLLGDPDPLVRRAAFQTVNSVWRDPATAKAMAKALDLESLGDDMLELLAREAPEPIPSRIATHLQGLGPRRDAEQQSLYLTLAARSDPDHVLARLREDVARGRARLDEVTVVAGLSDAGVPALLAQVATGADAGVAYAAAEALAAHPNTQRDDLLDVLERTRHGAVVAVVAGWAAQHSDRAVAAALAERPAPLDPDAEREILRALRRGAPELGAERFRRALGAHTWFLQAEGALGLRALGDGGGVDLRQERLDPLAQEVLSAEAV